VEESEREVGWKWKEVEGRARAWIESTVVESWNKVEGGNRKVEGVKRRWKADGREMEGTWIILVHTP